MDDIAEAKEPSIDKWLAADSRNAPAERKPALEWLPDDRPFAEHPALGRLGRIFDQDYTNIVNVQRGLHSTVRDGLILGRCQEARIRHYHQRIDQFIATGRSAEQHG